MFSVTLPNGFALTLDLPLAVWLAGVLVAGVGLVCRRALPGKE